MTVALKAPPPTNTAPTTWYPPLNAMATAAPPSDFQFWLDQEIDLLFCANDISCMKQAAADYLGAARAILERKAASESPLAGKR